MCPSSGAFDPNDLEQALPKACLSEPQTLAKFFILPDRSIALDEPALERRLDLQDVIGSNLNDGFDQFDSKANTSDRLEPVLKVADPALIQSSDVVAWRGVLTRVMCIPYGDRLGSEKVEFLVASHEGTLFMTDKERDESGMEKRRMLYRGFRFETIAMRSVLTGQRDAVTRNTVEWAHLISAKLGALRLLYGAEVDGWDETRSYPVELKTNKEIKSQSDERSFNNKLMRIWAQSFLAGIPQIIVGFRDRDWIVRRVESIKTQNIPRRVRGRVSWDPNHMLSYLCAFIGFLREHCAQSPGTVFKVVYDPHPLSGQQHVTIEATTESNLGICRLGPSCAHAL